MLKELKEGISGKKAVVLVTVLDIHDYHIK